mgnify:CR=1 FL=1
MARHWIAVAVVATLAACSGGSDSGRSALVAGPGTPPTDPDGDTPSPSPSPSDSVSTIDEDGEARSISYDAATDTFIVDNLPFDGDGKYDRDDVLASIGPFAVYENNNTTERRAYKAIRAEGPSGETRVAVVRSGDYEGTGFGGFLFARDGGVTLPSTGQATYTGDYAGLRVFDGVSGLEFTEADALIEIDFEDFNAGDAVEGVLTNRRILDQSGNLIGTLPALVLATGSISPDGQISGTGGSDIFDPGRGEVVDFESGEYVGVIADDAGEVVGIVEVTGTEISGAERDFLETGAFVATSP